MFDCTLCGICCKHIAKELKDFDRGDGVCKYLKDNLCTIYDKRPQICNVDLMYEKYFSKHYSKKHFYELNTKACQLLQAQFSKDN